MVKTLAALALFAFLALCAPGCLVQAPQVLTDDNGSGGAGDGEPIGLAQQALGGGAGGDDGAGGSGALCCCTAPSDGQIMQCHVEGSSAGCPAYTSELPGACSTPTKGRGPCDGSVVGSGASGVDAVAVAVPLLALAAFRARRRRRARRSGPSVQGGRHTST